MAGLVKALEGRKIVLLFNAKQLLTQTYEFLTEACGMENIGLCFGEGYIYGDVMLCTVQSIEKIIDTQWHNIIAWNKTAELAEMFLEKGKEVAVEGKLTTRSWDDEKGNKKYITEVVCNEILFLGSKG